MANLPGVVSHVWTGILAAHVLLPGHTPQWNMFVHFSWLAACGVLLCVGGNLLNDWHDREWDARYRPERALPAGHYPPGRFLAAGLLCLLAALVIAAICHPLAAAVCVLIIVCIGVYTKWHKQSAWTVAPLALCRALLPLMAAIAVAGMGSGLVGAPWFWLLLPTAALFLFVASLSLDARHESRPCGARHGWVARTMILIAPLAALGFWHGNLWPSVAIALLPVGIWLAQVFTRLREPVKARVSGLLAGLPLVDAAFVLPYPILVLFGTFAPWDSLATASLVVPLAAFAAGRLLQRAAAAT